MPKEGLNNLRAVFVYSRLASKVWDEFLSFIKHEKDVGFDFERTFASMEKFSGEVDY